MTEGTGPDFVPARGAGSDLFDAPALFFLTHEELITKWHALEGAAVAACIAYLESLHPDLEDVADAHGCVLTSATTGRISPSC